MAFFFLKRSYHKEYRVLAFFGSRVVHVVTKTNQAIQDREGLSMHCIRQDIDSFIPDKDVIECDAHCIASRSY